MARVPRFQRTPVVEPDAKPTLAPVIATPNHRQLNDAQREVEIELARQRMVSAPHLSPEAHAACDRMTALIKGRSAAQVARMEQERGLARQR